LQADDATFTTKLAYYINRQLQLHFANCARDKEIFDVPMTSFCFDKIQQLIHESQFDVKWIPTILTKQVRSMETPSVMSWKTA
jgi:hypothetical protein